MELDYASLSAEIPQNEVKNILTEVSKRNLGLNKDPSSFATKNEDAIRPTEDFEMPDDSVRNERAVVDYIAGFTDVFFFRESQGIYK